MRKQNKDKIRIGEWGEGFACEILKKKGYEIIERNFYIGGGEIDIICSKSDLLVFVEVRVRSSVEYQDLYDTIDPRKEKILIRSCEEYLAISTLPDYRIDLFAVLIQRHNIKRYIHVKGII